MRSGIPCPKCKGIRSDVVDTRAAGNAVRRRRQCPKGHRFTTYETLGTSVASTLVRRVIREEADRAAAHAAETARAAFLAVAGIEP